MQGSGKGTLSARLVQKYDLEFVASGDVLRREIMNKTEVGRAAEEIVASGGELKWRWWWKWEVDNELMIGHLLCWLDSIITGRFDVEDNHARVEQATREGEGYFDLFCHLGEEKHELKRFLGPRLQSWILDGFPRTLAQGEMLDKALTAQGRPFNMIVHLAVPDSVIMKRISGEHL